MAEIKINDLTAYTSPVSTDVLPIVDVGNDVTKKVSIADLVALAAVSSVNTQTGAVVLDADDISDSSTTNKFATATQLTDIGTAVQPGDNVSTLTNDAGYITATGTYWTEGTNQLYPSDAGNDVLIGGTLPSSPNITLKADGSAEFAGSVVVGTSSNSTFSSLANTIVAKDAGNAGITVSSGATSSGSVFFADDDNTSIGRITYEHNGDYMRFYTANSERLRIDSSGRVGIGTAFPGRKFVVQETSTSVDAEVVSLADNATLRLTSDESSDARLFFGTSVSQGAGRVTYENSTNSLAFWANTSERARINSSGNVLIGGTLPSAPNISLNADGSASFESTVSSESFFESDRSFSTGACFVGKNSGSQTSKISADGSAEFAGKLVSASTVSGDIGTTLATKDYVDSVPTAPVDSVNSQTGAVVLDAGDVGAATAAQGSTADSALQPGDNVSELVNDAGYITSAPVDSVNGQTGVVVLDADNIDDTSTTHKFATAAQLTDIGTAVQPGDLATVATSGAYGDLSGTPATAVPAAGGTFTGDVEFDGDIAADGVYTGAVTAVGALAIDCSSSNYFTKTINGNSTFTFTNVPSTRAFGFTLELTHTSGTVTWPASVKFPADTAPTLTTGKTHIFVFVTDDGGTRFRGAALVDYIN